MNKMQTHSLAALLMGLSFLFPARLEAQVQGYVRKMPSSSVQTPATTSPSMRTRGASSPNARTAAPAATPADPSTPTGRYEVVKSVPDRNPPKIEGDALPTRLYVVQLARFEEMYAVPPRFPKGTFIWANPDNKNEKMLYAGFYYSIEEATKAAAEWKKKGIEYKDAFARPEPWIVRYD
jgi:hypothetical protein